MRFILALVALSLVALPLAGCSGCGEPTMTLKSPIAFGTQSTGVPYQTVRVPMAAPQTYVQQASPCAPAQAAPQYVPVPQSYP